MRLGSGGFRATWAYISILRGDEAQLEQLLSRGSSETVGAVDVDGNTVAVILIHHFVGVMVDVVGIVRTAVSSMIAASLLCHTELLTRKMSEHSSTSIKLNIILF
jgi:hypothetical protein